MLQQDTVTSASVRRDSSNSVSILVVIPSTCGDRNSVYHSSQRHARNILLSHSAQPASLPACAPCPSFPWWRACVPERSLALLIVAAAGMDERLISTPPAASHILGQHLQHRDLEAGARSSLTSDPMGIQAARGLMLAETLGSSSSKGSVVPMG